MLGQHGIKSAPPPSLPASPGVWSCSPMLSTIAARAAGPARPLWNRVAFMTLVLPRFGSSGHAGAVQSGCRRRVRDVRWCSPPHQRRSWRYQERCRSWWYRSRNAAALPHHRYWRGRRWWSMQPKECGPPVSMFADRVGRPTRPVRRRTTQRCLRACRRVTISAVRCPRLGELLLVVIPETLIINRATSQGRFRPGDIAGRS